MRAIQKLEYYGRQLLAALGLIADPIDWVDVDNSEYNGRRYWRGETVSGRRIEGSFATDA